MRSRREADGAAGLGLKGADTGASSQERHSGSRKEGSKRGGEGGGEGVMGGGHEGNGDGRSNISYRVWSEREGGREGGGPKYREKDRTRAGAVRL